MDVITDNIEDLYYEFYSDVLSRIDSVLTDYFPFNSLLGCKKWVTKQINNFLK